MGVSGLTRGKESVNHECKEGEKVREVKRKNSLKGQREVEGGSSEMMKHLSSLIENREGGNDEDTEKEGN